MSRETDPLGADFQGPQGLSRGTGSPRGFVNAAMEYHTAIGIAFARATPRAAQRRALMPRGAPIRGTRSETIQQRRRIPPPVSTTSVWASPFHSFIASNRSHQPGSLAARSAAIQSYPASQYAPSRGRSRVAAPRTHASSHLSAVSGCMPVPDQGQVVATLDDEALVTTEPVPVARRKEWRAAIGPARKSAASDIATLVGPDALRSRCLEPSRGIAPPP